MNITRALPLALVLLTGAAPAQEPGITRAQADAILNELRQIRLLLEKAVRPAAPGSADAQGAAQRARLKIAGAPWLGNKDAPLTMVEFTDYQCGFCRQFHVSTFPELRKKYIDTGKLRFLSRDLPLEIHSNAFQAALAARCAGDQGKFWEMRDVLVENAAKLSAEDIYGYAQALKLNAAPFRQCVDSGKYRAAVETDLNEAATLNINGTPTFVIGKTTPEGVEGFVIPGAQPLSTFESILNQLGK